MGGVKNLILNMLGMSSSSPPVALPVPPVDQTAEETKIQLDLYKMEYEQGAERYDNIYKALWTQFNYFVIGAGAILTFGKDAWGAELSGLLACLTIVFWYWTEFEPLNAYGDIVGTRLEEIEQVLTAAHFSTATNKQKEGLHQYEQFASRLRDRDLNKDAVSQWRSITILSILIFFVCTVLLTVYKWPPPPPATNSSLAWWRAMDMAVIVLTVGIGSYGLVLWTHKEKIWMEDLSSKKRQINVRGGIRILAALLHIAAMMLLFVYVSRVARGESVAASNETKFAVQGSNGTVSVKMDSTEFHDLVEQNKELLRQLQQLQHQISTPTNAPGKTH